MSSHELRSYGLKGVYCPEDLKGEVDGLYGRLPTELMRLVRRVADAPNYDFGAMELLDAIGVEWRK